MTKTRKEIAKNYFLVTIGCFVLALGSALFLVPNNLVTGGITSIAIIIQYFITKSGSAFQVIDIVTWAVQILFLLVSFIFLGRQYTIRSIYATALYPFFFTLFYRIQVYDGQSLGVFIAHAMADNGQEPLATLLLAAVFGGLFVGFGVSLSFAGGGTTGGLDVLAVLIAKVSPIKEGQITFMIDGTLVAIGMLVMWDINQGLLGIVSAFMCAMVIQFAYVRGSTFVIADVVTENVDQLKDYVVKEMDRSTTIFSAEGGYSGQKKTVVRVCFSKRQLNDFKSALHSIDPNAFITFVNASMIHGEGFDPLVTPNAKELIKQASETRKKKNKEE